jgi:superfamily II DNA or RNA helicase
MNETFMHVSCDPSIERELSEHFQFFVPGYKFMPAYRNRMWDGKIRLYDFKKQTLYNGLFKYLKEFADLREYKVITAASPAYGKIGETQNVDLKPFLAPLVISGVGKRIIPRNYQLDALSCTLQNKNGLLLSPTASGKSLIIYLAIKWYLDYCNDDVLIIVPTTSLVEQMYSDFADYSSQDESFNTDELCYKIYGGADRHNIKQRVLISTWQSIYKLGPQWFQRFGMVVGDEAHQFKAKSLTSIMEKCTEAEYRIGTTGTLDGTQTHQLVLEGLFGPVHKVTTTKELMDKDTLAKLSIDVILLKYKDEFCRENRKYQDELDFIVGYEPRNDFITELALRLKGNTLVLFNYVEKHGKPLHNLLKEKIDDKRKLFYVSGETDVDTREQTRAITEKEDDAIIVASIGTFSTGINIRKLHNIVFASPSKSQIRVLQSIGRGLRKSPDGRNTKVFDIADDLHWKSRKNYTLNHAAERIKIYSKEKFDYNLNDINI